MSLEKAMSALSFIPPDDRETWVRMGMALKNEFADNAFDAWTMWSQGAESYDEKSAKAVWRSIKSAGKVGIGTLFHEAAARGWRDNGTHRGPLTAREIEEKRAAQAARDAATIAEDDRKGRGYRVAAELSQKLIDACSRETHYYLNSKGLPEAIGLVADGVLVVPMRNLQTNQLQGAQTIEWMPEERQWQKKMVPGMRAKGAVLRLGSPRAAETYLAEGYATCLSIEAAIRRLKLNSSVLVCFSDSNLACIASMLTGRVFVIADNDVSCAGEKAAKKTGFPYVMSDVIGFDANDHHQKFGLTALCALIMKVRKM